MFRGKKVLCVATAVLIAVPMMFAGCQSKSTETKKKDPVKLTLWLPGDDQKGLDRINTAINDHLKSKGSYISVNLQLMGWGTTYEQKATNMFTTGGDDADLIFTCNWLNNFRLNATKGYLADLTSYLKTTEGKEVVKILGEDFLGASKIQGKNYALPTNKEKAHDWGFLVKTELFNRYGMDASKIKKLEDMEPYFDKAKADKAIPLCIAAFDGPWHFLDWDMVSDDDLPAAIDDTANKVINPFTDPKSIALFKEMKAYQGKGYISKDATTAQGIDAELKTGKYLCGVNSLKPGKDKEQSVNAGMDYTQIDITPIVKSNRETTGAMVGINNFSKHKDAAFDLLSMLYTDKDLVNLIVFGQEGTDYSVNSNGTITTKKSDYVYGQGWIVGNQLNDKLLNTESPDKWKNFADFNDKATALPSLGFIYDNTNTATKMASLKTIVDTYYKQLHAGLVNDVDATINEMTKKLDAAGEADVLKDMQTQYDTFLSSKK